MEYTEWRNFCNAIDKAKTACKNSRNNVLDHFVDVNKMVQAGVAPKEIDDIELSVMLVARHQHINHHDLASQRAMKVC